MNERAWVIEAIKFYRPMDFFAEYSALTDEQLADELIARRKEVFEKSYLEKDIEAKEEAAKDHEEWELVEPEAAADMILLWHDKNRVWWEDGETDIWPEGKIYVKFLQDCSRISRGAFVIHDIQEEWENGVLEGVLFDWNGERWRVVPDSESTGWIDFRVTEQINSFIEETGYKFLGHWVGDQTTYLVVLTEAEKEKFESQRGWSFYESFD